jgi:hypothetical protein
MKEVRITVMASKNYRTEVRVNDIFVYQTGLHVRVEIDNLTKLFTALNDNNIIIEEAKEIL